MTTIERASQICSNPAYQVSGIPNPTDSDAPNVDALNDFYLLLNMLDIVKRASGQPATDNTYSCDSTDETWGMCSLNFYANQLSQAAPSFARETYTSFQIAHPEWTASSTVRFTIIALMKRLTGSMANRLDDTGIDLGRVPDGIGNPPSKNVMQRIAAGNGTAADLNLVKSWVAKVLLVQNYRTWVNNLASPAGLAALNTLKESASGTDRALLENIIILANDLKMILSASNDFTVALGQLSGGDTPEDVNKTDGTNGIYLGIHGEVTDTTYRSAGRKTRETLFQLAQSNPQIRNMIVGILGQNFTDANSLGQLTSENLAALMEQVKALLGPLCVHAAPPPVCPGDPSCPPDPTGVLPPPLLNPIAYEGVGQLNWLDNLAVKYHLLPHAQLTAGGQYNSLDANQIGQPDSAMGSLGGSAGLDWSTGVGEGYTLSLGADGGYHYDGTFGSNSEPGFHSGSVSGSVAGISTNYLPNFELGLRGVFTDNGRSELSPWTSPTGNAFSLNALISQPLYRFGSGVLSLDVPGGLDLGWYEPFGPGSGPLPDESPNFMRGTIGGGLRLNLDVPLTLFAGYRHIWEMPSRYFMDQAYGYQTYEGNGAYLGLGAQAGLWSGNLMFNYDVMTNWNDQWKASFFNQFDLGGFAPGFGVSAGQGNFYDVQSTDVNGEVGVYDIKINPLSTDYFETSLDVVANGGYSWLDNGSEGYVVGGGVRVNFGPSSDPTGVEELYPAGAMLTTDANLTDAYLTAETDEVGAIYTDTRVQQMLGVAPYAITEQMVADYAQMFKVGNLINYQLTSGSLGDDGDCSVAVAGDTISFGDVAPVPANLEPRQYVMIGAARYQVATTQSEAENPVKAPILGTLLAQAALHVTRMIVDNNYWFMGEDDNRLPQDLTWFGASGVKGIKDYLPEGTTREEFVVMLKDELAGGVIGKATLALLRKRLQLQPEQVITREYIMKIYSEIQENAPVMVAEEEPTEEADTTIEFTIVEEAPAGEAQAEAGGTIIAPQK